MIYIKNNEFNTYEPDIRPLINSFYPGVQIAYTECDTDLFFDIDEICRNIERSEDRFHDKSAVKKAVYEYLVDYTGRELPWGTLTGIRPVRIAEKYEADFIDADKMVSAADSDYTNAEPNTEEKNKYNSTAEVCGALKDKYSSLRMLRGLLKKDFLITDEKLDLLLDIYGREKNVLSQIDYKNGYSIYIGIPFCPTRCVYCSFTAYPYHLWKNRAEEYIEKLGEELADIVKMNSNPAACELLGAQDLNASKTSQSEDVNASKMHHKGNILCGKELQTIYIGGGTPSVLSAELIEKLMQTIEKYVDISKLAEFTFEAGRPDTITREKLEVLRRHNVTRISINPQTMCQKTLDLIGRKHTVEQIKETFKLARELGFDNINMDVIAGLPGENLDDFKYTLSEIAKLDPDNLTVHTLAVKRASRLNTEGNAWGGMDREGLDKKGAEEVLRMTELGAEYADKNGLNPYYIYRQKNMAGNLENIGYAKPGKENLYNILMMEEKHSVISCGAGSSTKRVNPDKSVERCENVKDIASYLDRTGEMLERKRNLLTVNN